MMGIYQIVEEVTKDFFQHTLLVMLDLFGLDAEVYRADLSAPYSVYGEEGVEGSLTQVDVGKVLITESGGFEPYSPEEAGFLETSYVYTDLNLQPGDIINVVRDDQSSFRFRVDSKESVGFSDSVIERWRVRPLVD